MLDIAKRMQKVLPRIMRGPHAPGYGAGGAKPRSADKWSKDFAVIEGVIFDPRPAGERYFDADAWFADMRNLILFAFEARGETVVTIRNFETVKVTKKTPRRRVFRTWVKPGTIVIHFNQILPNRKKDRETQEVTVYRAFV